MFGPLLQMVPFLVNLFTLFLVRDIQPHPSPIHYVWKSAAPPKVKAFS